MREEIIFKMAIQSTANNWSLEILNNTFDENPCSCCYGKRINWYLPDELIKEIINLFYFKTKEIARQETKEIIKNYWANYFLLTCPNQRGRK